MTTALISLLVVAYLLALLMLAAFLVEGERTSAPYGAAVVVCLAVTLMWPVVVLAVLRDALLRVRDAAPDDFPCTKWRGGIQGGED